MSERDRITELEHRIGQATMEAGSWRMMPGWMPCAEAGERILSALDVPRPEWPRQPSRTAEDAQERTGSGEGGSPAPGSPGPVAAITAALEGNWRERVTVALDASVDRCARCKVCDNQVDAVMAAILPLAELENAITWGTSCTSCARVLDSAYEQTCRAERAEEKVGRLEISVAAGDELIRDILEALCRRNGLSLESAVEPGEPARNYELALRLGIGRAFGIQETPGD